MPTAHDLFLDFLLPALIVAAGFFLAWFPWRNRQRNGRWIGGPLVAAAFALADCGIGGVPRWPPGAGDASYWLVWFAAPVALLGLLDALLTPPDWLRAGILFVLIRIGASLLIAPLVPRSGPALSATLWSMQTSLDAMALIAVLWWLPLETLSANNPGPMVPAIVSLTLAAAALVLGLGNDIKPSQLAVALTGAAFVATLAGWRFKSLALNRGALLAWTIPLLGTLTVVHFYYYTEPPAASVALLLIAPLLAFTGDLPPARKLTPGRRRFVRMAPVVLALAIAVGVSVIAFVHNQAAAQKTAAQQDDY